MYLSIITHKPFLMQKQFEHFYFEKHSDLYDCSLNYLQHLCFMVDAFRGLANHYYIVWGGEVPPWDGEGSVTFLVIQGLNRDKTVLWP